MLEFKDKLTKLYDLYVYENGNKTNVTLIDESTGIYKVKNIAVSTQDIKTDVINKIDDSIFLKCIYDASVLSIPNTEILYTIKYNTIEDNTDYITVTLFNNQMEFARKYMKVGDHIAIQGRISTYKNNMGSYGRFADAAKYIDPREE